MVAALPQSESGATFPTCRNDAQVFAVAFRSSGAEGTSKIEIGEFELDLVGASRGECGARWRAPERRAFGELGMAKTDAAQRVGEHKGQVMSRVDGCRST
jgi:hypothetical protein